MNEIMKDPNNIRKGKEWLKMMPEQLQEKWFYYINEINNKGFVDWKLNHESTFDEFIKGSFLFNETLEGVFYWQSISEGRFGINEKKSFWSKLINFFKL
jgi:hypothetical protein